jgi:dipeptidyl aminopeptidase/acylaminoacyl peptidase
LVVSKDPDAGAGGFSWSRDGRAVAIEFRAIDNKDRWIASVDFDRQVLVPQHRLTDPAWIGWRFNEFGWLNDNRTLWYASEESGFGHLYTKSPGAVPRALTQGRFEISDAALSADGRWFFVLSNAEAPYAYDVYRVASSGGALQRVTRLEGVESFAVEHTGKRLLVTHSSSYMPAQLAVAQADGSGTARDLTETRTAEYRSLAWIAPEIVRVPSTHVDGVVYAKVYRASGDGGAYGAGTAVGSDGADGAAGAGGGGGSGGAGDARDAGGRGAQNSARRPAVVFVHGAGYTQNVHLRFPYYFREQMFNNLLAQKGYVVIDLDYRASSGYGRDWRTAIYRQMGHPELEDLLDVKQWLVEHEGVDPQRIGVYGGSYGGFMTLMALFRAPGEFAAGAALRPVTDWMQYEHDYTSDILNEPQTDPAAYARSSPIEYAAGLKDALLICHGVVDDNVLFEDSMRLYQRLIELHKDNFSISPYPLDSHGFINADSWIDEYKRIDRLFESTLRP